MGWSSPTGWNGDGWARAAVSGGFSPTSLTNLIGWYKADAGVTTSGGNVTAVVDQSGATNNLINFGTVPFSATSAYNSQPAFNFTVANNAALVTGTGTTGTVVLPAAAFTVWGIGRMNTATDSNGGCVVLAQGAGGNDFNDPHNIVLLSRTGATSFIETYYNSASPQVDTAMSTGTNHRWVVTCDGTNFQQYVDGVAGSSGTGTYTVNLGFPPNIIIGNRWLIGVIGGGAWDGPICEAGIAMSFSSSTTVGLLDAYLVGKWGS